MVKRYVEIIVSAILLVLLILFGVFSAYLQLEVVNLKDQIQNLENAYDRLYENFELVLSVINHPLTPISETDAIRIALKHRGLNETALGQVNASATLYFVRSEETKQSFSFEILYEIEEPRVVFKPFRIGNFTYRYIWSITIRQEDVPLPAGRGVFLIDAATGEVIRWC